MKKLLRFLKPYKKESILGPLFKLIEASFELIVPLVVASIVNRGIGQGDTGHIFKMGGVMILLAAVGLVCAVFAQFFAAKAATGFAAGLREELFSNIQKRSFSKLDEYSTSTLITRITSDVNQLQTGINLVLRLFLRSPFIVFGAVVMAFVVDAKEALIFVVCVPILFIIVFFVLLKSIPLYKKVQTSLDKVTLRTRENLIGVRVLRAFNAEDEEIEAFENETSEYKALQLIAGRVGAIMNPATFLVVNAATVGILYFGAKEVNNGLIEQATLIALINYMSQILVELVKLANLIITITKSLACADRISDMLSEELPECRIKKEIAVVDTIEFKKVSFTYPKAKKESLKEVSFRAKKGEIIGIIGGTGSGKSTLVNLICGYYPIDSGEIAINKIPVSKWVENCAEKVNSLNSSEAFRIIMRGVTSTVHQTAVLFNGSVEDNLKWGKKNASESEMEDALKAASAYDFVMEKEGGLKAEVTEGGKNFSGGQRQRLSMARAFVKDSEILILDDSTSALDYITEKKVREAIRKMSEDKITFIVSQRAAGIMDADRILVMDNGRLVGAGTHEELLNKCGVYREIFKSQFPDYDIEKEGRHEK